MLTGATTTRLGPNDRPLGDEKSRGGSRKLLPRSRGGNRWLRWFAAALMWVVAAVAADQSAPEPEVKAVFLFKLAPFVEWPESAWPKSDAPLVIGVLGDDPIVAALAKTVKNETVRGRRIAVKQFAREEHPTGCHIVFVTRAARERIQDVLKAAGAHPVLTVSDNEGFCKQGGMVTFVVRESLKLQVNPNEANKVGLRISAQLLRLAEIVRTGP